MTRYITDANSNNHIIRIEGGVRSVIPFDVNNRDYQKFLTWLAEGNTPEAAEGV
jgi:hypothetical protein